MGTDRDTENEIGSHPRTGAGMPEVVAERAPAVTREEFAEYEAVRRSGVTNMFNAKLVAELTGLTRARVIQIMGEYAWLSQQYPDVTA